MGEAIVVTGGTGTLGRKLVPLLAGIGHDIRTIGRGATGLDGHRHFQGDLLADGPWITKAVAGASTIIHCAGAAKGDGAIAANMVRAAVDAGVSRIVHLSVVGVGRIPTTGFLNRVMFNYFAEKTAAEVAVQRSGMDWAILRSTQFNELLLKVVQALSHMPVVPVPQGFKFQPIAAAEVAALVAGIVRDRVTGIMEIGGPQVVTFNELVSTYERAVRLRKVHIPIWLPGTGAAAFRKGANLCTSSRSGGIGWASYVNRLYPPTGAATVERTIR